MTVKQLYEKLSARIPEELREEWDNDGLMCSPDTDQTVHRVLVSLDVTENIADYAIEHNFDLIVSHHPLIFRPLRSLTDDDNVARKVIKLLDNGVSVFSFHTRADKVKDGVNDQLCDLLEIRDPVPFGEGCLGRIGTIDEELSLADFAYRLKEQLCVSSVLVADGDNNVHRVAVVGGDGKSYIRDAIRAGADTFVSGRIGYNDMEEAAEWGINLIEAGHFFTEHPVTNFFSGLVTRADPTVYVEVINSNLIQLL